MTNKIFILGLLIPFCLSFSDGIDCEYEKIGRIYKCNSTTNKWETSFDLGILPLDISNIKIEREGELTKVYGRIIEQHTGEGIPNAPIYFLDSDTINCFLQSQITITDSIGRFSLTHKSSKEFSIYCQYVGMEGIELKIKNCR